MGDNDLERKVGQLDESIDTTAMITWMNAEVVKVSGRWQAVCTVFKDAWKDGMDLHVAALQEVSATKKAREEAARNRINMLFELACVFLPIIGGRIAIRLAPIVTARGELLAKHVERSLTAEWTNLTKNSPVIAKALEKVGEHAGSQVKDAAAAIQKDIIEAMTPKVPVKTAPPSDTDPASFFEKKNREMDDMMKTWIAQFAKWNVEKGWQRHLVPVAYNLFKVHPWVTQAPTAEKTNEIQPDLTKFIEMALWMRWAKTLDEKYWKEIHEWYWKEYFNASRMGKDGQVRGRAKRWTIDALDFQPVWKRIGKVLPKNYWFSKLTLLDPESGMILAERDTIDMYTLIKTAKHRSASHHVLNSLIKSKNVDSDFTNALSQM